MRREVSWGQPCLAMPVYVVEDTDELLATYIAVDAPIAYADVPWPTPTGRHPWWPRARWEGEHGALMLQRPGDAYAVFVFWDGPERRHGAWYLNLQAPFRRTAIGYDTEDHELDLVVLPTGEWFFKDEDVLTESVRFGRYSAAAGAAVRDQGARIVDMLVEGRCWWEEPWIGWSPDPDWVSPPLPPDLWLTEP